MSTLTEYEWETLGELDGEFENEWELEHELEYEGELEGEAEAEQFFGALAGLASRAAQSPALRRIGLKAARAALRGVGGMIAGQTEFEGEGEYEWEGELNPVRKWYPDAMMEHMGHLAANAESEQEAAEHFLPLIPLVAAKLAPLAAKALPVAGKLAAKVAPKIMSGVMKVAPKLTQGIGQVAKTLFRNPTTRPLLRTVPSIARRTTAQLARQIARGRPITGRSAVQALAQQTARTLSNPRQSVKAWKRSRSLDRRAHQAISGGTPGAVPARSTCPTCGR